MLTAEQVALVDETRKFLDAESSPARVRALARGQEPDGRYWRRGAELGWTSLLVPESEGGGCVSDRPFSDLALIASEFGRHAAPGPLIPANVVAAALARHGTSGDWRGALQGILAGDVVAAPCFAEAGRVRPVARERTGGYRLSGCVTPVEAGAESRLLLIAAAIGAETALFCVPADAPGVAIEPLRSLDLTRRFAAVRLDDVAVPESALLAAPPDGGAAQEWLTSVAVVLQVAEMAGAMDRGFDIAVDWVTHRFSFGRTLASYQAIKHRFADMRMWLDASHAIAAAAAAALSDAASDATELASVAKSYVGHYGPELMHECVQMLGGIGVTFDHDIHLYLRRVVASVPIHGSPAVHRERLTALLERQEVEA